MTKSKKTPAWGKKTAATSFVKSRGCVRGWANKTCAEANDFVMNDLRHRALGGPCPVCLQTCKVYRRSLSYKAEEAGKTITGVKARGTSQECSKCGAMVPKALLESLSLS